MPPKSRTAARTGARARIRRNTEEILADLEIVYQKPVEEWDWEELSFGCPRDADGNFPGQKPKWITPIIAAEAKRRMREMTEDQLLRFGQDAIRLLMKLVKNDEVDEWGRPVVSASVKMQGLQYILNQVLGTPVAKVAVVSGSPLEAMLADVLVNPDGEASHDNRMVIDMEEGDDDMDGGE